MPPGCRHGPSEQPDQVEIRAAYAACLLDIDSRAALRECERVIAAAPDDEYAHRIRALALLKRGRKRKALAAARRAAALAPFEPLTHVVVVQVARALGRRAAGAEAARRVAELAPHSVEAAWALSVTAKGRGWPQVAERHAQAGLALDPENLSLLRALAQAQIASGRGADGLRTMAEVAARDPADPGAREGVAQAARLMGTSQHWFWLPLALLAATATRIPGAPVLVFLAFFASKGIRRRRELRRLPRPLAEFARENGTEVRVREVLAVAAIGVVVIALVLWIAYPA